MNLVFRSAGEGLPAGSLRVRLLRRLFLATLCGAFGVSFVYQPAPAKSLPEPLKRAIVRIETPEGKLGTGFVLSDSALGFFLVTNKHVIYSCSTMSYFDELRVRVNHLSADGKVAAIDSAGKLLLTRNGQSLFVEHPSPGIDLVLVQLGYLVDLVGEFQNPSPFDVIHGFKLSAVATRDDFKRFDIRDGTAVQVIGFSFQVRHEVQFHISRFGHVSIAPGVEFPLSIVPPCNSVPTTAKADWLVLDLTSRGGDSGGPIFALELGAIGLKLVGLVAAGNQAEEFCFGVPSYRILELIGLARSLAHPEAVKTR